MVAGTICFSVLLTGVTAAMIALFKPDTDIAKIVVLLGDVLNTLIGLLAGFLAGRSDTTYQQMKRDQTDLRTDEGGGDHRA